MKKILLISLIVIVSALSLFAWLGPAQIDAKMNPVTKHNTWPVSNAAQALHESLLIGDWHSDSLLWNRDFLEAHDYGHVRPTTFTTGQCGIPSFNRRYQNTLWYELTKATQLKLMTS